MTPRLFIRDEAAADILLATAWYDEQRDGLGSEYTRAINGQLAAIERQPRLFRIVHQDVRHAIVRRFPYAVYFTIQGEQIIVIACLHLRRDPTIWHSRR